MSKKISKLGIDVKQADIQMLKNYKGMEEADKMIFQLQDLESILKEDPKREAYIKITRKRIGHLLLKMLEKPLSNDIDNLMWHAEVRGRLMEQVQHANVLTEVGAAKGWFTRFKEGLLSANSSLSKRKERQG